MTRRRRIGLGAVAGLALALFGGCKFYWAKPGATHEMFRSDNLECARAAAPNPTAAAHGIVDDKLYRACLMSRGWVREQHPEPPPPGWYRGFE